MNTTRLATRLAVPLLAGAILTVASTGTGYAYWRTSGSGSGTAATGTSAALTTSGPAASGLLYPGGTSTGTITISNSNTVPVVVNRVVFAAPTASGGQGGCSTDGVAFAAATGPVTVAARGTATVSYTASMSTSSDNGCQGATFTAAYTLEAVSG